MAARRIIQLGDPLLREVSRPVATPAAAAATLTDLRDTLHEFQRTHGFGRGIAAVQIGIPERVIYIEIHGQSYPLVNPEWISLSDEKFQLWDDCFSFPNLMVWLERSRQCVLRYQNEDGSWRTILAEDDFAELLQHEMDHLDGVLAVDRAMDRNSLAMRDEILRRKQST